MMDRTQAVAIDIVSPEDYLKNYAHNYYEWVEGVLVKLSPIHAPHDNQSIYLRTLFDTYNLHFHTIGAVKNAPFLMELEAVNVKREPDIQVILPTNMVNFTPTSMTGPADICVEIVSSESVKRDHGEKFFEYEAGGVQEYWIVDPLRDEGRFYRRNAEGRFIPQSPDADGNYRTPLLPGFVLHVPSLWQHELPNVFDILVMVQKMLEDSPPEA